MRIKSGFVLSVVLWALALSPADARADLLYFTVNAVRGNAGLTPTLLFSIDTETLLIERLGTIPNRLIPGLAPSPERGVLFGADRENGELITIDVTTFPDAGSVTVVGSFGRDIRELAYDASTDTLYGFDFGSEELFVIDHTTGAAAAMPIGDTGLRLRGLTFDQSTQTLYGMAAAADGGALHEIDPETAAATPVMGSNPGLDQISGIHVGAGSSMYGVGRDDAANFYAINEATGVASERTPIELAGQRKARDLAAPFPNPAAMAPVAGPWGLIAVAFLLAGGAMLRLRGHRR